MVAIFGQIEVALANCITDTLENKCMQTLHMTDGVLSKSCVVLCMFACYCVCALHVMCIVHAFYSQAFADCNC